MKRVLIVIISIVFTLFVNANEIYNQKIDSAATYYSNAKFEKAIEVYEQILADDYESAELYYNLGNAYFKSNKIALSIVNYERAKKLLPSDEDIEFNLSLANTHVVDKIDVVPEFFLSSWWSRFIQLLTSNEWGYISLFAFVVGLILLLFFFLSHKVLTRKLSFWIAIILIISSLFSFSFSKKQMWIAQNEPDAIILTPSVIVRSAPSEGGTELFLIHEGLKVKVTDKLGDWREVRLSDGNKGWIKEIDVLVI
ncbi:MAG: tetratricopeptide repeat protein [Salinivirgaceae bacterium]|nr:tetratricopeptide repeat protein [Salinivirgaceae bacterium]